MVFLSYAIADAGVADQVVRDLVRSGIDAWSYERHGEPGVDWKREIQDVIARSSHFCLLDSPHARASEWVRWECRYLLSLEAGQGAPRKIVCALPGDVGNLPELFPAQTYFRHLGFHDYHDGIRNLCRFLGRPYLQRFTVPRDADFATELRALPLPVAERQFLIDLYGTYSERRSEDADVAEAALILLVDRCRRKRIHVAAPYLALAVFQGDHVEADSRREKSERVALAHRLFRELTTVLPDDPRGWAGAGTTAFAAGDREGARSFLAEAMRRVDRATQHDHVVERPNVLYNYAVTLRSLGRLDEAAELLEREAAAVAGSGRLLGLFGEILLAQGRWARAAGVLRTVIDDPDHLTDTGPAAVLAHAHAVGRLEGPEAAVQSLRRGLERFPEEVDLNRALAQELQALGRYDEATSVLEEALEEEWSIRMCAELTLLYYARPATDEVRRRARSLVARALSVPPETPEERWFRGLVLYLEGDRKGADRDFRESRAQHPGLDSLGTYADLIAPAADAEPHRHLR